jgi:hypothetical protein
MKSQILRIDENHRYWLGEKNIPGVSEIINSVFPFTGSGLAVERASNFGSAVHKAIELDIKGVLDWSTVDDAIKPYLEQFWKFRTENNILRTQCQTETILSSKKYGFAGTIDIIEKDVIDIKSGQKSPRHRIQIAAYRHLVNSNAPAKYKRQRGLLVYLNGKDEIPEVVEEKKSDFGVFLSCLNIHNFRKGENL